MCDICHEGGQVLGPFLKPMTHLVHTEYLLAGRSERDPREILRDTMYAATVTGAPVENACRLIAEYESEGRGYYAAALALFGRDAEGHHTMDSPILIRTADVAPDGRLKVTAGATLVRDSDAAYEVAETHAKAGGILGAFGLVPQATAPADEIAALTRDEDVLLALGTRNQRLSRFWLTDQEGAPPDPSLAGQTRGDPARRGRLREHAAPRARRLRHDVDRGPPRGLRDRGLRRRGPRRRRPRSRRPARRRPPQDRGVPRGRSTTCSPRASPFLAVCLGHQTLCDRLGIPLGFKDIVFQGTQSPIPLAGRTERVGFYNTFVGRVQRRRRAARGRHASSATRRPATCTRSPGRTSAASSSTPSRSSPRTATTSSTTSCAASSPIVDNSGRHCISRAWQATDPLPDASPSVTNTTDGGVQVVRTTSPGCGRVPAAPSRP